MANNIQLTGNIQSVTFQPQGFIRIDGRVWSRQREGLSVSDELNRYNKQWFWSTTLPQPVDEILLRAGKEATEDLVEKGALPTFWPPGLMETDQKFPINIDIEQLCIYNRSWYSDTKNIATFRLSSSIHWPGSRIETSEVAFDLDHKLEEEIFKILEEYM